jgi:SHAQKYF class myb-like DNA-binding protein
MTITTRVKSELFETSSDGQHQLIRIAPEPHQPRRMCTSPLGLARPPSMSSGPAWTNSEHSRFLQALELYPSGPWKVVAAFIGTKTPRQVMTHAQKYRQKIARRKRGLKICTGSVDIAAPTTADQLATSTPTQSEHQCGATSDTYDDETTLSISELDLQLFEADTALYPLLKELEGIGSLELDDCIVEELEPLEVGDGLCACISPEQAALMQQALFGTRVTTDVAFL